MPYTDIVILHKLGVQIKHDHDKVPQKEAYSGSRDMFMFSEINDNISQTVRDRRIVMVKHYQVLICSLLNDVNINDL